MGEYASSGKTMLITIIIFFFLIVLLISLHFYSQWYLRRAAAARLRRRTRRRSNISLNAGPINVDEGNVAPTRGLSASLLRSLPLFVFSAKAGVPDLADCAVCLSEFEENEPARELPKCRHVFHVECIDMWFESHDTCPLCRSSVEPVDEPKNPVEVLITVPEPIPISGSDLCETCRDQDSETSSSISTSTSSEIEKPIAIVIPSRDSDGFGNESSTRSESPASHRAFRSSISQILSLKRILSQEWKTTPSPSSAVTPKSCGGGSAAESDIEKGVEETR